MTRSTARPTPDRGWQGALLAFELRELGAGLFYRRSGTALHMRISPNRATFSKYARSKGRASHQSEPARTDCF